MKKPNIIFYFSDQQRYDTICEQVTPNIENLKQSAATFDNAYTCQPVCGPARACLQTGLFASQNGAFRNDIMLNTQYNTLAKILNANGYDTAYIGKWHLASNGMLENYQTKAVPEPRRGGYRYWRAADCLEFTSTGNDGGYVYDNDDNKCSWQGARATAINNFAIEYLDKEYNDSKPFFIFISQLEPHHQNSNNKYECPQGLGEKYKDMPIPQDLTGLKGNYNSRYADYLGCCNLLDSCLATLIDKLKDMGIWDNTILIYTSDHGCHFTTRNFEYKRSCHDASIHVPLIISGGSFAKGARHDQLVSLIDLPPTILDMAGINVPQEWQGTSLLDVAKGKSIHDAIYIELSESQLGRAIRTKDYTYSVRARRSLGVEKGSAKVYIEDKLYDNHADPHQLDNKILDPEYKAIRLQLRQQLLAEIEKNNKMRVTIRPKLTRYKLNP